MQDIQQHYLAHGFYSLNFATSLIFFPHYGHILLSWYILCAVQYFSFYIQHWKPWNYAIFICAGDAEAAAVFNVYFLLDSGSFWKQKMKSKRLIVNISLLYNNIKRPNLQYSCLFKVKWWGPLHLLSNMCSQGGKFLGKRMMQGSMCLVRNVLDLKNINKPNSKGNKMCTLNIFFFSSSF